MNSKLVIIARLQDAEAIFRQIREVYGPEIFWISAKEGHFDPNSDLDMKLANLKGKEKSRLDAHDYLDTPLCHIEVGLHRSKNKADEIFLSQLNLAFTLIDSYQPPLLAPTLETSLESQQRYWKILEYKVIDETSCTWVARGKRVYPFPTEDERTHTLLVRGFQCLILDKETARQLFPPRA